MPQTAAQNLHIPRGIKRTCLNEACGRKFYDLNQTSSACPYCATPSVITVVERHEFEMAVGPKKGKVYRLEAISAPSSQDQEPEQDQSTKDDELFSPPDAIVDIEDDENEAPNQVLGQETDGEAS